MAERICRLKESKEITVENAGAGLSGLEGANERREMMKPAVTESSVGVLLNVIEALTRGAGSL